MAYDIWSTCMLVPGFSRSECASWVQAWGSIGAIVGAAWVAIAQTARQHKNALELRNLQESARIQMEIHRAVRCAARVAPPMIDAVAAIETRGPAWAFESDVRDWLSYFAEEHRLDDARGAILAIAIDPVFTISAIDLDALGPLPCDAALNLSRAQGLLRLLQQRIEAKVWYVNQAEAEIAADVSRWHADLAVAGRLLVPALAVCQSVINFER